jgi:hypothetical protein
MADAHGNRNRFDGRRGPSRATELVPGGERDVEDRGSVMDIGCGIVGDVASWRLKKIGADVQTAVFQTSF